MSRTSPRTGTRLLVRAVAVVVTLGAVAVPAAVAADRLLADPMLSDQHDAPEPSLTAAQLGAFRERGPGSEAIDPIVLSYHDVRPEPGEDDPYTLTPQQFADQMAMLDAAGFDPITGDELMAWTRGEADLPDHPIVITFDDGTRGLWAWADRIMERHAFPGIAFAVTGLIDEHRPYYLSWSEVQRMHASGRWEFESHTSDGHHRIPTDADGEIGPFLTQQKWLGETGRLETVEEFRARVSDDLERSVDDLVSRGLPAPEMFAYPFSAAEPIPFDPELEKVVKDELHARFETTLINSEQPGPLTQRDVEDRELRRLEVLNTMSAEQLFDRLVDVNAIPLDGERRPMQDRSRWLDNSFMPAGGQLADGTWRPTSEREWVRVTYAPGQTAAWDHYEASAVVGDLGGHGEHRYGGLTVLSGTDREVHVNVSGDYVTVQEGPASERTLGESLPAADAHRITLTVTPTAIRVAVDGRVLTELPPPADAETGGVALVAGRDGDEPWPTVSDLVVRPHQGAADAEPS